MRKPMGYDTDEYMQFKEEYREELLADAVSWIDPVVMGMTRQQALTLAGAMKNNGFAREDFEEIMKKSPEDKGTFAKQWDRFNGKGAHGEATEATIFDDAIKCGWSWPDPREFSTASVTKKPKPPKRANTKIQCLMDSKEYKEKPVSVWEIRNREPVPTPMPQEFTIPEFADAVTSGRTFYPTVYNKVDTGRVSERGKPIYEYLPILQQIFSVDIDNEEEYIDEDGKKRKRRIDHPLTIPDALEICRKNDLRPILIYETFSSKYHRDDKDAPYQKFRIVFAAKKPFLISEIGEIGRSKLVNYFIRLFGPAADAVTTDAARMIYGTDEKDSAILGDEDSFIDNEILLEVIYNAALDKPTVYESTPKGIILGAWLSGEHLDDIKRIPPADFEELTSVAKAIKRGETDPLRVAKVAKVEPALIGKLIEGYSESLYLSAASTVLRAKRAEWIKEHPEATPEEIRERLEPEEKLQQKPIEIHEFQDLFPDYLDILEDRASEKRLQTDIADLDSLTGGIHRGDLTAVGARPSTGKSSFLLQVALTAATNGARVLFFSLEMPTDQIMDRTVLQYTEKTRQGDLRDGVLSDGQRDEVCNIGMNLSREIKALAVENERDIDQIEAIIKEYKPDFVAIDQLSHLSRRGDFGSIRERFSYMTTNLKRIAIEQNVGIWLACQLNRTADANSEPSMDQLKESGTIEEDSDVVLLLWRDFEEEAKRQGELRGDRVMNVKVEKQRSGPQGRFALRFVVKKYFFDDDVMAGFYPDEEQVSFDS